MTRTRRLSRRTTTLLGVAVGWSIVLVVAALTFPIYGTETVDQTGRDVIHARTLVQENGLSGLVVTAVPLVVSATVWLLLRTGSPVARRWAWGVTAVLGGFTVLGLMSIGMFVLPVVLLLAFGCSSAAHHAYWGTGLGVPGAPPVD